jgi:hypothetical protein
VTEIINGAAACAVLCACSGGPFGLALVSTDSVDTGVTGEMVVGDEPRLVEAASSWNEGGEHDYVSMPDGRISDDGSGEAWASLDAVPTADAPVDSGHVPVPICEGSSLFKSCTSCGGSVYCNSTYCPGCGVTDGGACAGQLVPCIGIPNVTGCTYQGCTYVGTAP